MSVCTLVQGPAQARGIVSSGAALRWLWATSVGAGNWTESSPTAVCAISHSATMKPSSNPFLRVSLSTCRGQNEGERTGRKRQTDPSRVVHTCDPVLRKWEQKDEEWKAIQSSPEKLRPTWGYVDPALKKKKRRGAERRTNRDGVKYEELEPVFRRLVRGFRLNCRTRLFQRVGLALRFQRSSLPIELLLSIH